MDCSTINKKLQVIGENLKLTYLYGIVSNKLTIDYLKLMNKKKIKQEEKLCKIIFNA